MKSVKQCILFLFLLTIIVGCENNSGVNVSPANIEISFLQDSTRVTHKYDSTSTEYKLVQEWFTNNKNEWSTSYASFIDVFIIRSETFECNFLKDIVVLNYKKGDKYSQVMKTMKPEDKIFIGKLKELLTQK
jgi:hypothetical protein